MTGPAPGKLRVEDAKVILVTPEEVKTLDADVYIHVKGYSFARVTHIDVEHPELNNIVPPGTGIYAPVRGTGWGFTVSFERLIKGVVLEVESRILSRIFRYGERSWCYVGGKHGGIFLGLRKEYVKRLEEIAKHVYGVEPKRREREE